ncbi:hypothetical protein LCM17_07885 [Cereibacter sphaeroides]|nr:hypothetical protein [Cereibacter sphaeroides]
MAINSLTTLALSAGLLAFVAACTPTTGENGSGSSPAQAFEVSRLEISPMTPASLCRDLGGQGQSPTVTIRHSAAAGVPIRLHMQDNMSNGNTFDHGSTSVMSDGSGTTVVRYGFRPPCNTTNGRRNSHYRLTVEAGGRSQVISWGRFDSASRTIR